MESALGSIGGSWTGSDLDGLRRTKPRNLREAPASCPAISRRRLKRRAIELLGATG